MKCPLFSKTTVYLNDPYILALIGRHGGSFAIDSTRVVSTADVLCSSGGCQLAQGPPVLVRGGGPGEGLWRLGVSLRDGGVEGCGVSPWWRCPSVVVYNYIDRQHLHQNTTNKMFSMELWRLVSHTQFISYMTRVTPLSINNFRISGGTE